MITLGDDITSLNVEPVNSLKGKKFFLYVSTIEARKNHFVLLKAWELLAEDPELNGAKLVLVGMPGWGTQDLISEMQRNPRLRSRVVLRTQLPDAQLNWLYANTLFTVFPSIYEGWGLPVSESLRWGKPVIISDAPSLAEAAQGLAPVLRPYDIEGWQSTIRRLFIDTDYRLSLEAKVKSSYKQRSWDACFSDVMGIVGVRTRRNK
jgi:glycosyltransferase involved in cell wall biosynthesis